MRTETRNNIVASLSGVTLTLDDRIDALVDLGFTAAADRLGESEFAALCDERADWPTHQPGPAWEAPIPGTHWYGGCDPDYPRVNPETGRCESCGERACRVCGRSNCPDGCES